MVIEEREMGDELTTHEFLVDEQSYVINDVNLDQEENNSDSGGRSMPLREQDRFLPIANIAKIMKNVIPQNGKIAKDARECVQECISEFISFITSEASDRCLLEKRKTINGEDVLYAMNALGFDNYVDPLKLYLRKYRDIVLTPSVRQSVFQVMNSTGNPEESDGILDIKQVDVSDQHVDSENTMSNKQTILLYEDNLITGGNGDEDEEPAVLYAYATS